MAAPTYIPVRGDIKSHSGPLGIVKVSQPRSTEIEALMVPHYSKGLYIFDAPTYENRNGVVVNMVWCPQCGDWRKREDFHRNRARPNGLQSWCRKHDDTVNERVRAYRARQRALKQTAA